ncbi:hypothetical protein GHA01_20640 [Novacetimonas hansenii]|uniref:Uncharacterized protein n=1 Tax=Novacetimonas hansenii TaxID=436 RepID=A0ABQ0SG69_NOVHA|nr:hypothetical protein Gaha_0061_015 [Novacetimonas hansenii JCM 7643]GBQ61177.1 hypothetical protein AA0243_2580 [Novacetimonas hansenii NRIC 0243]GEC64215.1 hypothetical protein GHA01_20640 [Novacetimonas hansenii]
MWRGSDLLLNRRVMLRLIEVPFNSLGHACHIKGTVNKRPVGILPTFDTKRTQDPLKILRTSSLPSPSHLIRP